MVVIEYISAAMQIKANCHFHSRPLRNSPPTGNRENSLCLRHEAPLQHPTAFIPIHTAFAYLKQLSGTGSLPSASLSLLTNKHDNNIVSQAVVCYRAAR